MKKVSEAAKKRYANAGGALWGPPMIVIQEMVKKFKVIEPRCFRCKGSIVREPDNPRAYYCFQCGRQYRVGEGKMVKRWG